MCLRAPLTTAFTRRKIRIPPAARNIMSVTDRVAISGFLPQKSTCECHVALLQTEEIFD